MADVKDFIIKDNVLIKYTSDENRVVVPEGGTSISTSAFVQKKAVKITIPDSIVSIDKKAFEKCKNILEISFSGNIPDFTAGSFAGCSAVYFSVPQENICAHKNLPTALK